MKAIFLNKENKIRNGWKILIFFVNFIVLLLLLNLSFALFLPITDIFISELIALISVVISTFLMMKFFEKRNFEDVGLRLKPNAIYEISLGLILGFIMITSVVAVNLTLGYYKYELTLNQIYPQIFKAFLLFLMVALFEEILFRGYPFQRLIDGTSPIVATLIFSLIFSLAHLQNPNVNLIAVLNIFFAGIWLSASYIKTRSLWLPISLHFSWNFFQGYFYSLPVSGLTLIEPAFNVEISSENIISGGKFGPEGSVITSFVLVIATIFILKSKRLSSDVKIS
ncbi:MAG: lysostaphin resistance A-like protein [Candidatus Kryptonium sp.]